MRDNILGLLGLARRGRRVEIGEEPVGAACYVGVARVVLVAFDAAPSSVRRAEKLARMGQAPCIICPFGKAELGHALGRASCAMAAVTDPGLAAEVMARLAGPPAPGYGPPAHRRPAPPPPAHRRPAPPPPAHRRAAPPPPPPGRRDPHGGPLRRKAHGGPGHWGPKPPTGKKRGGKAPRSNRRWPD